MNKLRALGFTVSVITLLSGNIPVALALFWVSGIGLEDDKDSHYRNTSYSQNDTSSEPEMGVILTHLTRQNENQYYSDLSKRREAAWDAEKASRR